MIRAFSDPYIFSFCFSLIYSFSLLSRYDAMRCTFVRQNGKEYVEKINDFIEEVSIVRLSVFVVENKFTSLNTKKLLPQVRIDGSTFCFPLRVFPVYIVS